MSNHPKPGTSLGTVARPKHPELSPYWKFRNELEEERLRRLAQDRALYATRRDFINARRRALAAQKRAAKSGTIN